MIDLGLASGIKELWQENLLRDYTIIAEGKELKVHRVVLAAVSQYFKPMLCDGFMESKTDKVEVKGFSADIVTKLLEFIYTANESVIDGDILGILRCAIYLQMPLVAEFCVQKLMENMNIRNCLEILSALIEYSFQEKVIELKNYLKTNFKGVVDNFNPEATSYEALQVLIDLWGRSEWEKFLLVKNWISVNRNDSRAYVNDLLSQVPFCLIGPDELQSISKMDIFAEAEGSWQNLVVKALDYHKLPINLKVLDKSEQSKVTDEPLPTFFTTHMIGRSRQVGDFYALADTKWKKCEHKGFLASDSDELPYLIYSQVNNYLIVCTVGVEGQMWQIFDPRTLTWSDMPSMNQSKTAFEMVHHRDILYTVGGITAQNIPAEIIEQYNFLTSEWSSVHRMPAPLSALGACVLGDKLYMSGGWIQEGQSESGYPSDKLCSLDLSSHSADWEMKAPCLYKWCDHKMFVICRNGEEVLFLIDYDLHMECYIPSEDQWVEIHFAHLPDNYGDHWLHNGAVIARGNTVFLLNVSTPIFEEETDDVDDRIPLTWSWDVPEEQRVITEWNSQGFPHKVTTSNIIGAMLAIPPQHLGL